MKEFLRRVPGVVRLWRALGRAQHAAVLRLSRRRNYTFTQFCRLPTQLELLAGPVLDAIGKGGSAASVRVLLFGSSTGAEAYSLASTFAARRPRLSFRIECFDIAPDMVGRTQRGVYAPDELSRRSGLPVGFVERTFDVREGEFMVKFALRARVSAEVGDVLDARLMGALGKADFVLAQNFLYHLRRREAVRAFRHLIDLLAPRAALVVDGADLDLRTRCTAEAGLEPWPEEVERVHEEAREERGYAWRRIYWGLEPYDHERRDALRRYATIFVKGMLDRVQP